MNKLTKTNEGISGAYPAMTFGQEALSVIATALIIILPMLFQHFRMSLSKPQIRDLANNIIQTVKKDSASGTLKQKIVRATNFLLQKMSSKPVSLEKELNALLPDNIEAKTEQEVTNEIKRSQMNIKRTRLPSSYRG